MFAAIASGPVNVALKSVWGVRLAGWQQGGRVAD